MSDPNQPPPPPGGQPPPPGGPPPAPPAGGGGYTPPPAQPYQPGGGPQRLEVGAAVSYGWEKFTQHWQAFVLLVLGVWLAMIVVGAVAFGVTSALADSGAVVFFLVWAVFTALIFIVGFAVQAGVYRAGLGVTQGREPSFTMFTEGTNLGPYILTVLVVGLGAAVGFVLCVIPGIIWLFFMAYAPLRALDKGEGPGDAMRGSYEMVRENAGQVLLVVLVCYAIYAVGAALCYVGLLVSIPVALVALCWSYRVILQEPVAP